MIASSGYVPGFTPTTSISDYSYWTGSDMYTIHTPSKVDCNGKDIKKGDTVIYSKGVKGYLKESVITRFTKKSVILEDGYVISLENLKKLRKI